MVRISHAAIVFGLLAMAGMAQYAHSATTLMPNGEQCFQTGAGPVVAGSVNMYTVGTTTPKTTWTNSSQSAVNTNPIQLDANGCAIIYGVGAYRQQLWTGPVSGGVATGNQVYDLTTTDTSASNNTFWAGTAGGTPNAITVVDAGFNNTDGTVINFLASNTNTAATTLAVSGGSPINIEQYSATGPAALTAGCIVTNNPVSVVYSSSQAAFLMLAPCAAAAAQTVIDIVPGGYLTLSSDVNNVVQTGDILAATTVWYMPYIYPTVPIFNGTNMIFFGIPALSLSLTASHLSNTIYDVFVFSNSGNPTLATGPAWLSSAVGAGNRGTGAGTTQLTRVGTGGTWTNAVAISGTNGAASYNIPVNQATYLGSILIDTGANGQISSETSYGQNRKWGVYNAYNRQVITLNAGDSTVNWTYNTAVIRASNNNSANNVTVFTGLAEEQYQAFFYQLGTTSSGSQANIVGFNTTTTINGLASGVQGFNASTTTGSMVATGLIVATAAIGQNQFNMLERGSGAGTNIFEGGTGAMQMTVKWRG